MRILMLSVVAVVGYSTACLTAVAQQPPEYGPPITLAQAKPVMAAAEAEARRQDWPVAIAIVDNAGLLVMFQRLENTQLASVQIAIEKASTSALFRRPTKAFEDRLAEGGANLKLLRLPGGLPMEGGLPIMVDGKVIGGIGVSGVLSTQDALVGEAGLQALSDSEPQSSRAPQAQTVIQGIVTLDGQPLDDAGIVLVPESGEAVAGTTTADGSFTIRINSQQLPASGTYRVQISKRTDAADPADDSGVVERAELIPARYNRKSSLQVSVVPGQPQNFHFDLTSASVTEAR